MNSAADVVVFAGGGSGGHLSPGLAIAERLAERSPPVAARFLCSTRAIDAEMLGRAGASFVPIPAAPLALRPAAAWRFLRAWPRATAASRAALRACDARVVVTLGGFVAAPVAAAARSLDLPLVLLNLDDPPGRANRWIARRANHRWSAVATDRLHRAERTGMPIRRAALAPLDPAACRAALELAPDRRVLLVTGASQGATSINLLLPALATVQPEAFAGWQVLHLAGAGADCPALARRYAEAGVPAVVLPFLHEMGRAWGAADLAVSRSGASSVAEVAANAVPTLFLPYPHHRDDHQRRNAEPLRERGAAEIETDRVTVEANLPAAGARIAALLCDEPRRRELRERLLAAPPVDAASGIAARLVDLLGVRQGRIAR